MPELANCPNCGKVFAKAIRTVCNACFREVEDKFEVVRTFIRKKGNRTSTMEEVTEATGVEQDLIVRFIREGRLHLSQFPNLGYPCEKCGVPTRDGRICGDCNNEIRSDLQKLDSEAAFKNRQNQREKDKIKTYHSLNSRLKR